MVLGLAHVIARDGLIDRAFIDARTEGYEEVEALIDLYTPEHAQYMEITGVPAADFERAAHIYAEAENASWLWGSGSPSTNTAPRSSG